MACNENDHEFEKRVARTILASVQKPVIGEAGKLGSWRTLRPIIHNDKCLVVKSGKPTCFYCWLYCPEGMIPRTIRLRLIMIIAKDVACVPMNALRKRLRSAPEKGEGPISCEDNTPPSEEP